MGNSDYYRFTITRPKQEPKTKEDAKWSAYSRIDKLRYYEDTREKLCCRIKDELGGDEKMRCCKRRNKWIFTFVDDIKVPVVKEI